MRVYVVRSCVVMSDHDSGVCMCLWDAAAHRAACPPGARTDLWRGQLHEWAAAANRTSSRHVPRAHTCVHTCSPPYTSSLYSRRSFTLMYTNLHLPLHLFLYFHVIHIFKWRIYVTSNRSKHNLKYL